MNKRRTFFFCFIAEIPQDIFSFDCRLVTIILHHGAVVIKRRKYAPPLSHPTKKTLVPIINIEYGSIDALLKKIHGLRLFKAIGEIIISAAIEDFEAYEAQETVIRAACKVISKLICQILNCAHSIHAQIRKILYLLHIVYKFLPLLRSSILLAGICRNTRIHLT